MKLVRKINEIFSFTKIKEAEGAEVWLVYWNVVVPSTYGTMWNKGHRAYKAFLLKEDAESFAQTLEEANMLLQNENDICCKIVKQK